MYGRWNVVDVEIHWDTIALSCTEIISRAVICVLRVYISSYVRLYPLLISNFHRFKIPTDKNFKFLKPILTYRTIINNANAERSSKISQNGRIINLLSGKIDHIFESSKEIKKCLKKY